MSFRTGYSSPWSSTSSYSSSRSTGSSYSSTRSASKDAGYSSSSLLRGGSSSSCGSNYRSSYSGGSLAGSSSLLGSSSYRPTSTYSSGSSYGLGATKERSLSRDRLGTSGSRYSSSEKISALGEKDKDHAKSSNSYLSNYTRHLSLKDTDRLSSPSTSSYGSSSSYRLYGRGTSSSRAPVGDEPSSSSTTSSRPSSICYSRSSSRDVSKPSEAAPETSSASTATSSSTGSSYLRYSSASKSEPSCSSTLRSSRLSTSASRKAEQQEESAGKKAGGKEDQGDNEEEVRVVSRATSPRCPAHSNKASENLPEEVVKRNKANKPSTAHKEVQASPTDEPEGRQSRYGNFYSTRTSSSYLDRYSCSPLSRYTSRYGSGSSSYSSSIGRSDSKSEVTKKKVESPEVSTPTTPTTPAPTTTTTTTTPTTTATTTTSVPQPPSPTPSKKTKSATATTTSPTTTTTTTTTTTATNGPSPLAKSKTTTSGIPPVPTSPKAAPASGTKKSTKKKSASGKSLSSSSGDESSSRSASKTQTSGSKKNSIQPPPETTPAVPVSEVTSKKPPKKPGISSAVLGMANKEFRKSVLNLDLGGKEAEEFRRKQEELREAQLKAKKDKKFRSASTNQIQDVINGLKPAKKKTQNENKSDLQNSSSVGKMTNNKNALTKIPTRSSSKASMTNGVSRVSSGSDRTRMSSSQDDESESSSPSSSSSSSSSSSDEDEEVDEETPSQKAQQSQQQSPQRSKLPRSQNGSRRSSVKSSRSSCSSLDKEETGQQETSGVASPKPKQTSFLSRAIQAASGVLSWPRRQESGQREWWLASCDDVAGAAKNQKASDSPTTSKTKSGKDAADSSESSSEESSSEDDAPASQAQKKPLPKAVLGTRTSPDGLESPPTEVPPVSQRPPPSAKKDNQAGSKGMEPASPTDPKASVGGVVASPSQKRVGGGRPRRQKNLNLFIGNMTNIDDILGSVSPVNAFEAMLSDDDRKDSRRGSKASQGSSSGSSSAVEVDAASVKIHDSTAQKPVLQRFSKDGTVFPARRKSAGKLDDTALQLYKDGDYGTYLDLEASISEQHEDFEGFQNNRKNAIVLRTQLSVRVHTIIEKLLNSEGRDLRRALFSLKQIFQEDKDLVHEFVQNEGLACLMKVGSEADQNYQNYILRALGQVMLYVDGMNGVMEHNETVQWLYSLVASKFRLVVKTALKLLLVFVEYVESNCMLLIRAVHSVDTSRGLLPWHNVMRLLKENDTTDTELLVFAMTLVNKVLNATNDQDTYYDQVDKMEEQGMEQIIHCYMSKPGVDLDLLCQFQLYEAVLRHEDGEEENVPIKLDDSTRQKLKSRKSVLDVESTERRKSRRHSTNSYSSPNNNNSSGPVLVTPQQNQIRRVSREESGSSSETSSSHSASPAPNDRSIAIHMNGSCNDRSVGDAGVTPALRRRRERVQRQRSFLKEQQESAAFLRSAAQNSGGSDPEPVSESITRRQVYGDHQEERKDVGLLLRRTGKKEMNGVPESVPPLQLLRQGKSWAKESEVGGLSPPAEVIQLTRENTVKDLTQKLSAGQSPQGTGPEEKAARIGDLSGIISKAKEGLAKSKSRPDLKAPTSPPALDIGKPEPPKKSENELQWESLVTNLTRPLFLCDLDFSDLKSEDDVSVLVSEAVSNGLPPPPPPPPGVAPPPPPPAKVPPALPSTPTTPSNSSFGVSLRHHQLCGSGLRNANSQPQPPAQPQPPPPPKKTKKTVKLFWKEVRDDPCAAVKLQKSGLIWDDITPVQLDVQRLEHLFENRAKDLLSKKQQEMNKAKEITVLDPKRSNAINIGMTKLPPSRTIKGAIMKMDISIINREGIEKLLTMLPTEEERSKIQEAQLANPDVPLGSAEQFLITLASVSELPARLKLWAFKLDYENMEKEVAEPLMDLKQGMEALQNNKTFRHILAALLSIGNFLNGVEAKGFQIEYLAKVPEVKDTVHKHTLLHHLSHTIMEKFPDSTDLYSEVGAITRASRVDFDEVASSIQKMETECKASWDHLKVIAKHDGNASTIKVKMSDFLSDCAERIIVLGIVHRRVMNRFYKFMLWLGVPLHQIPHTKPNVFSKIISEFALEYRTTRDRVIQQMEKKANHRERNKTRGKMITEMAKFKTKEDKADAELRQLLGSDVSDTESVRGTWGSLRPKRDSGRASLKYYGGKKAECVGDPDRDDEILESLVKTATKAPDRSTPRERKRTRNTDRKSLRRTLRNGLSEEERKHLAAFISTCY